MDNMKLIYFEMIIRLCFHDNHTIVLSQDNLPVIYVFFHEPSKGSFVGKIL